MAFFIIELYEYFPNKFFCVGEERILSPFYSGESVNLLNSHKKSTWVKHFLKFTFSQWHCMSLCPCVMCKGKEEFWLLIFLSFIMWPLSITPSFIWAVYLFPLCTLGFSFRLPSFSLLISRNFYSRENKIKILFDCQLSLSFSQYCNLKDVCLKQNEFHKITTTGMVSLLTYLVLGLSDPIQRQWMCVPSANSDRGINAG